MAEQCGNAMRCVARYYYEKISSRKNTFAIETKVGVQPVWTDGKNVRVDMGKPVLAPAEIPVRLSGEKAVNQTIEANGGSFRFTAVSMGNPHAVIEVGDLDKFPVEKWGPVLEKHDMFPQKANIEFVTFQFAARGMDAGLGAGRRTNHGLRFRRLCDGRGRGCLPAALTGRPG